MKKIVANISGLRGVHYACLCKGGEQIVSTFPEDQDDSMMQVAEMIEQAYSALESIQKSYNQMYFSVGDQYIAAFCLHESYYAVMLTEKKINFPLINMGIKSASEKIRRLLRDEQKQEALLLAKAQLQATDKQESTELTIPTDDSIQQILNQYSAVLATFLGPAAKFVVEDCAKQWKQKYQQTEENLSHMVELIQKELDTDEEKQEFAQKIGLHQDSEYQVF